MNCKNIELIHIDKISRWVEVAVYDRVGKTAKDAITAYIASRHFGKTYMVPNEPGGSALHGPFPVPSISVADYVHSSINEYVSILDRFCFEYPENPEYRILSKTATEKLAALKTEVTNLTVEVYRLKKDKEYRDRQIGGVLNVFEEFLFLRENTLISIIIGED